MRDYASYPGLFMKVAALRVFALDRPALPGVDGSGTCSALGVGVWSLSAASAACFTGFERVSGRA